MSRDSPLCDTDISQLFYISLVLKYFRPCNKKRKWPNLLLWVRVYRLRLNCIVSQSRCKDISSSKCVYHFLLYEKHKKRDDLPFQWMYALRQYNLQIICQICVCSRKFIDTPVTYIFCIIYRKWQKQGKKARRKCPMKSLLQSLLKKTICPSRFKLL